MTLNGFLNVLKPPGITSSGVVARVRHMLPRASRVGHAGTLDPEAAGVLPIMLGNATRLFDYLADKEKAYVATLRTGIETDTQDAQGRVVAQVDFAPSREDILAVLPRFTGRIMQRPPAYSALKRGGVRLYELARAGKPVQAESRETLVHSLQLGEALPGGEWLLTVRCGRGTYVRTLCHDIGQALGCGAHMVFLLRTRVGAFALADAVPLDILTPDALPGLLWPMDAPLAHLPQVHAGEAALAACRNGNPLPLSALGLTERPAGTGPVRVYVDGRFAGIGSWAAKHLRFEAMLLAAEESPGKERA
ncbi:MAG: tRNA pseudouridine(55) synthase TruB [Oscillospiraceae bacterium]|jgi:tRNA pseudouridine55 synthase|nr:tRNA pseudouridine(55) synthase TruB [Oscillospiraceae bacterium]